MQTVFIIVILALLAGCTADQQRPVTTNQQPSDGQRPASVTNYGFEVVRRIPHDVTAFTQGLTVHNGVFIETTGQTGMSSVRRVDMRTGKVLKRTAMSAQVFGEGSTVLNNRIYALSWLNQAGFIYDVETLQQTGTFAYAGEGWGLTTDGTSIYMSNGTSMIAVRGPADMRIVRSFTVTKDGASLRDLNELEWIDGELWANVWRTDLIVRIDPSSGVVVGVIDLTGILPQAERSATTDVLNGIAYDAVSKAVYVTGKNWPWIYQINVK